MPVATSYSSEHTKWEWQQQAIFSRLTLCLKNVCGSTHFGEKSSIMVAYYFFQTVLIYSIVCIPKPLCIYLISGI